MHSTNPLIISCETTTRFLNNKFIRIKISAGRCRVPFDYFETATLFIETATAPESRPEIFEKTTYMERFGGRSEKLNANLADM